MVRALVTVVRRRRRVDRHPRPARPGCHGRRGPDAQPGQARAARSATSRSPAAWTGAGLAPGRARDVPVAPQAIGDRRRPCGHHGRTRRDGRPRKPPGSTRAARDPVGRRPRLIDPAARLAWRDAREGPAPARPAGVPDRQPVPGDRGDARGLRPLARRAHPHPAAARRARLAARGARPGPNRRSAPPPVLGDRARAPWRAGLRLFRAGPVPTVIGGANCSEQDRGAGPRAQVFADPNIPRRTRLLFGPPEPGPAFAVPWSTLSNRCPAPVPGRLGTGCSGEVDPGSAAPGVFVLNSTSAPPRSRAAWRG